MNTLRRLVSRRDFAIGCYLAIAACLIGIGVLLDFNKSEWAAWMQALGAVVAIVAAFVVAGGQHRAADARQQSDDRRTIATIRALYQDLHEMCIHANRSYQSGELAMLGDEPWVHLRQRAISIDRLPVFEIPSDKIAVSTVGLPAAVDLTCIALQRLAAEAEERDPIEFPAGPEFIKHLMFVIQKVDHTISLCDAELARLNS